MVLSVLAALAAGSTACTAEDGKPPDARPSAVRVDRRSVGERLAKESLRLADTDPRLSMAFALEAAELTQSPQVAAALNRLRKPHRIMSFKIGSSPVQALRLGGERRFLIGGDTSGEVRVWDAYNGRTRLSARVQGAVTEVALSYEADLAAIRSASGEVRVWDLGTGRLVRRFESVSSRTGGLAFVPTPEEELLAFSGRDGTVQLWTTKKWDRKTTLGPAGGSADLSWFLDERMMPVLATLSLHGDVEAWDLDSGRRLGIVRVPVNSDASQAEFVLDTEGHGDDTAVVSDGVTTWVMWLRSVVSRDSVTSDVVPLGRDLDLPTLYGSPLVAATNKQRDTITVLRVDPLNPHTIHRLLRRQITARGTRISAWAGREPQFGYWGPQPPPRVPAAVAFADGSVALWDLLQEKSPLPASKKAIQDELVQLCSGTPVVLSPEEWKKLIPELPYSPACVEVFKELEGAHD